MKPAPLMPMSPLPIVSPTRTPLPAPLPASLTSPTSINVSPSQTSEVKLAPLPILSPLPPIQPLAPLPQFSKSNDTFRSRESDKEVKLSKPIGQLPPLPVLSVPTNELPKPPETPMIEKEKVTTPFAPIAALPPLSSMVLPPLKKNDKVPAPEQPLQTLKPITLAPLAKEVKETREEQLKKIENEVVRAESRQLPAIGGLPEEMKSLMQPLSSLKMDLSKSELNPKTPMPLPPISQIKMPELPKPQENIPVSSPPQIKPLPPLSSIKSPSGQAIESLPSLVPLVPLKSDITTLEKVKEDQELKRGEALSIAQQGVKSGMLIEPQAGFQGNLAQKASPANLPAKKSKDTTPKIKIPKIISSSVKPSPKRLPRSLKGEETISLPQESTIIPPIPIASPSAITTPKTVVQTEDSELIRNINLIDVNKLRAERVRGKDVGYNVAELKVLASTLGLPKTGNKKDLVERIRAVVLKYKPNAFD